MANINANMTFTLTRNQTPDFPDGNYWSDQLRWAIAVMDYDDKSFPFVASCFSYCLRNDGVTKIQAKHLEKILSGLRDIFDDGNLICQNV